MARAKMKQSEIKIEQSKKSNQENFPVGSFLLPKKIRPHIFAYYDFARLGDDIADSAEISAEEKIHRLDMLERVLMGASEENIPEAIKLRQSLKESGVSPKHATDLLIAFRQDSEGYEYQIWPQLINYCRFSAAPVGRYMLDLHNEAISTHWCGDPLCIALQIINHLQDIKKDYLGLGRIYLPSDWMKEYGVSPSDLGKDKSTDNLRKLVNRMLEGTLGLLKEAQTLPKITQTLGLRLEVSVMLSLAERLCHKLRHQDMLAIRVELSPLECVLYSLRGIFKGLFTIPKTTQTESN